MRAPESVVVVTDHRTVDLANILVPLLPSTSRRDPSGPPFQGGVVGVATYELAHAFETIPGGRRSGWPQLVLARYDALLAFDHAEHRALAVGAGSADWLDAASSSPPWAGPLCGEVRSLTSRRRHEGSVGDVIDRIRDGEIFQANIARRWAGRLSVGAGPFDVFRRLAVSSPAPHAAYWRLPGRALVSNSPEQFLSVRGDCLGLVAESRPIKGTRPRGATPERDAALAAELLASAKDRAENVMIVDLMRNDFARCCAPGSVEVPELCRLQSFANVHHLTSRVRGRLQPGRTAWVSSARPSHQARSRARRKSRRWA